MRSVKILGLSAYYHDSAAAIVVDGNIVAAAQEERFSRRRHDARFPAAATEYCLKAAGTDLGDIDYVAFYDKPLLKFDRLLETYLAFAPRGLRSFTAAMPVWLKEKLYLKSELRNALSDLSGLPASELPALLFGQHHQSHAASAFYPSPFATAAVLCMDGVGEWATTSVWRGDGNRLEPVWQLDFPHSLGLLYSAFTYFAGFRVNSGEYKLMGLAPYGEPRYADEIRNSLVDVKADGTFRLDMDYFGFATGLEMTNQRFAGLFGGPPRAPEAPITQREMDLARSVQEVTEDIVSRLARSVRAELGLPKLCLAGGVALNCVANGRLLREAAFEELWIQPASGDAGGAVGAALCAWHSYLDQPRAPADDDRMLGSYLGTHYDDIDIARRLDALGAVYEQKSLAEVCEETARLLADNNVVGWFQGRMEFGPRALGARSILGDPRSRDMQSIMNLKIKYRESFRPFAPAVLAERAAEWFDLDAPSPYMLLVTRVASRHHLATSEHEQALTGLDKLKVPRTSIPAVTHVDYSARVQTVTATANPSFHRLLTAFDRLTGCPVLINTSFNVRGEPLVESPEDAYRCFMRTGMDHLVIGNCMLSKSAQPRLSDDDNWRERIAPD